MRARGKRQGRKKKAARKGRPFLGPLAGRILYGAQPQLASLESWPFLSMLGVIAMVMHRLAFNMSQACLSCRFLYRDGAVLAHRATLTLVEGARCPESGEPGRSAKPAARADLYGAV